MSRLAKLTSGGASWTTDAQSGQMVLDVANQHLLTRAAGYLKFADRHNGPVLFRGQVRLYDSLAPSLYRGIKSVKAKIKRDTAYNIAANQVDAAGGFIRSTAKYAWEPLLQHYGIRTRWIDLIDNVWVALWFACHNAIAVGKRGEYLHFERRSPRNDPNPYAYILLLQTGPLSVIPGRPGLMGNDEIRLIDLRTAIPSLYLRPHAQHALLLRRREINSTAHLDLQPFIVGTIRVGLADALSWVGQGDLLSPHSLFPPPTYDEGYRRLLSVNHLGNSVIGAIFHVGA